MTPFESKIPPLRPEPKRDRWGRYVLPHPEDGSRKSFTRTTTLTGALKDKEGLINWRRKMAVIGATEQPELAARVRELHAEVQSHGDDWKAAREAKDELTRVLDQLHHAGGGDEGADRGSQAHVLSEYADAGRLDEVYHLATDSELEDLGAYLGACQEHGIDRPAQWIERVVVNAQVESAGTLDRIVRLRDGRLCIGDYKSQKSIDYGFLEMATQLATYAHADAMWDDVAGAWEPMPQLDKTTGLIFHVPVGSATCTIYEVDLTTGWHAAQIAAEVRELRAASKTMGRAYVAPLGQPPVEQDLYLIRNAPHPDSLTALWRDLSARGQWTPAHTAEATARKAVLLGEAA